MTYSLNRLVLPRPADTRGARSQLDLSGAERFSIGRRLSQQGVAGYEPEVMALLCAYLEVAKGPVKFLDIGANIGFFSLALSALFGSKVDVTAFEPLPRLFDFITRAASRNGLHVVVRDCALSSSDGNARFYVSSKSDTSNSLNPAFRPHQTEIDVQVRSLDSLFPSGESGSYLVKIDTESTEPDVLEGGREFLARHRPPIVCEVLKGRTEQRLADFMSSVGYRGIHITAAPDWDGETAVAGDSTYQFRDWFFVPEPPPMALRMRHAAWMQAITAPERVASPRPWWRGLLGQILTRRRS
jgi:FkbM family methyltransferase